MDKKTFSEPDICTKCITPAVLKAGWDVDTQIREEVSFAKGHIIAWGQRTMFYAHSTSDPSQQDWQRLSDHRQSVAKLAGQHGEWLGVAKAAARAGLLHDLGKYTAEFQARLKGSPERVDHSTAGAWQVMRLASGNDDKVVSELISYAIAGHHAGLPDRIGASGSLCPGIWISRLPRPYRWRD
jgi:HD domain